MVATSVGIPGDCAAPAAAPSTSSARAVGVCDGAGLQRHGPVNERDSPPFDGLVDALDSDDSEHKTSRHVSQRRRFTSRAAPVEAEVANCA